MIRTKKAIGLTVGLYFLIGFTGAPARGANEVVTIPVVLADYYVWSYTEIFNDRADVFGGCTAGVDAIGWTLFFAAHDYDAGLFLVNATGDAKTVYPVFALLGAKDPSIRERAWVALGTHTATLLTLELLGRPALSIKTGMGPRQDGMGLDYAFRF